MCARLNSLGTLKFMSNNSNNFAENLFDKFASADVVM